MERLSDDGVIAAGLLRRAALWSPSAPVAPASLMQSGLPEAYIESLVLKHLLVGGELCSRDWSQRMALPMIVLEPVWTRLRAQRYLDVPRRGRLDAQMHWALTDLGRVRAQAAMERCGYVGPAPVALADYAARVLVQSRTQVRIDAGRLRESLGDAIVSVTLFEALGTALQSARAMFFYGPSGTGKTYLAQRLGGALSDPIWVPHAVLVNDAVVQIFDERVHRSLDAPVASLQLERPAAPDARWVEVLRPVVMTGGELTLDMLELQWDATLRFYGAPPQVKANNGVLVLDDLGRQRVSARDLMNRWIMPLDRQRDEWVLHTGSTVTVPFDVKVVFSSNVAPDALGDPALVRRIGYKLYVGALDEASYQTVVQQVCNQIGLGDMAESAAALLTDLHRRTQVPRYAALPRELLTVLRDRAEFRGEPMVLDEAALQWAWRVYGPVAHPAWEGVPTATMEEVA